MSQDRGTVHLSWEPSGTRNLSPCPTCPKKLLVYDLNFEQTKAMGIRFLIYGLMGWITEVVFTGAGSLVSGSLRLTGYTYLWMFPIYGMALFLEPVHDRIRSAPWPVRGVVYTTIIFVIEYLSGWLLQAVLGFCPWDYTNISAYTVDGLIRLDFFPAWFVAGLLFEKLHDLLVEFQRRLGRAN